MRIRLGRQARLEADRALALRCGAFIDAALKTDTPVTVALLAAELGVSRKAVAQALAGYTERRPLTTPAGRLITYRCAQGGESRAQIQQMGWS